MLTLKCMLPIIFFLTSFLGSFQLFFMEFMVGKVLLPYFGGAPTTWNTCMFFFQVVVLTGYLLAYRLISSRPKKLFTKSLWTLLLPFLLFLTLGLIVYLEPFKALDRMSEGAISNHPIQTILFYLTLHFFLPGLLLCSSSTLLQRWYGGITRTNQKIAYILYGAGNAGSLLALFSYPLVIENFFTTSTQLVLWKLGHVLWTFCILYLYYVFLKEGQNSKNPHQALELQDERVKVRIGKKVFVKWIYMAFVPSALLMGATTFITTELVSLPLFWCLPLSLYLLSFILAFSSGIRWNDRVVLIFDRSLVYLGIILILCLVFPVSLPEWFGLTVHLLFLFVSSFYFHRRLVEERGQFSQLGHFYVALALGGVLGGTFAGLLAPALFSDIYEYPLAVFLVLVLRPVGTVFQSTQNIIVKKLAMFLIIAAIFLGGIYLSLNYMDQIGDQLILKMILFSLATLFCFFYMKDRILFSVALTLLYLTMPVFFNTTGPKVIHQDRSFFGTIKVLEDSERKIHYMLHGSTLHGAQYTDEVNQGRPLAYYSRLGSINDLFKEVQSFWPNDSEVNVAVIGLGVGVLSMYARPKEVWTFYEIDPAVVQLAQNPKFFNYLSLSPANKNIRHILGDARLMLKKAPPSSYQVLILDAFSSDIVPFHLVTLEALQLYLDKLTPQGMMVFNISNLYFDYAKILISLADKLNLHIYLREDLFNESLAKMRSVENARWAVISKSPIPRFESNPKWFKAKGTPYPIIWTDEFSNILSIL